MNTPRHAEHGRKRVAAEMKRTTWVTELIICHLHGTKPNMIRKEVNVSSTFKQCAEQGCGKGIL